MHSPSHPQPSDAIDPVAVPNTPINKRKWIIGSLLLIAIFSGISGYMVSKIQRPGILCETAADLPQIKAGFLISLKVVPTATEGPSDLRGLAKALMRRLDQLKVLDYAVAMETPDRIHVQFPETIDISEPISQSLFKQGTFDIRAVHPESDTLISERLVGGTVSVPNFIEILNLSANPAQRVFAEDRPRLLQEKKTIVVDAQATLARGDVEQVHPSKSPLGGTGLRIKLTEKAGQAMAKLSAANIGKNLALMIDADAVSTPRVAAELGRDFEITASYTDPEAIALAAIIENPFPHRVELERMVPFKR